MLLENKCVDFRFSADAVHIHGDSVEVEIRDRVIITKGARDVAVYTIRSGRRKVVYIWFREPIGTSCVGELVEEISNVLASVKRVELSIGSYINIVLAGYFLVDYAILGRDIFVFLVSGNREIYIDKEDSVVTAYVV